jgi:hypothetical protein
MNILERGGNKMAGKWYSPDGRDYWENDLWLVDEWYKDGRLETNAEGHPVYYEADAEPVPFTKFFDPDDLLGRIEERGYDEAGELFNEGIFTGLREDKAAMDELTELVRGFLERHKCLPCYYDMVNVVEKEYVGEDGGEQEG